MLAFYIIVAVMAALLFVFLLVRVIWNIRLYNYEKKRGLETSKLNTQALRTNGVLMSMLLIVGVLASIGGVGIINQPKPMALKFSSVIKDGVVYENARSISSETELKKVFGSIMSNSKLRTNYDTNGLYFPMSIGEPSKGMDTMSPETGNEPNISDTYNQVKGVAEGDIAKVHESGKYLLYGPRNNNRIHKILLDEYGNHTGHSEVIILEKFIFNYMLLYKNKLVAFGYEVTPIAEDGRELQIDSDMVYPLPSYRPVKYEHVYYIIDTDTMEILKQEKLKGNVLDVRLVDNILYTYLNEFVKIDENGNVVNMDFENVFYFSGENNSAVVTRIYSINLDTPELKVKKIGFVGRNQTIYQGRGLIILTNDKWNYNAGFDLRSYNTTQVIAISYDSEGNMVYVGSQEVEGYLMDQYFLDVYDGMIRLVTTFGKNKSNHLYVLAVSRVSDKLKVIGHLTEGLGKPGEDVKSVHFNEDGRYVSVVTFLQTDPLYTIDLIDPTSPKIVDDIEEPGYSGVLFTWDDPKHRIGIGYMADLNGRITGLKVSAYVDSFEKPFTLEFPYNDFGYNTDVIYNPREHLVIDRVNGVFGFIVSYGIQKQTTSGEYTYVWAQNVLLFKVDFTSQQKLFQVKEMVVQLEEKNVTVIEKLVIVNNNLHILSEKRDYTWDIVNNWLNEPLNFYRNTTQ